MRRVVITGIGIISPIGNTVAEVEASHTGRYLAPMLAAARSRAAE